jgi:hypothetical protein
MSQWVLPFYKHKGKKAMAHERQPFFARLMLGLLTGALALVCGLWAYSSLANSASLSASPSTARQNDTVTLVGQGFAPGETVAVWITYPDYSVFGVAQLETNGDGSFSYPYLPDFLGASFTPTGKYTYTAKGLSSGFVVYADLQVNIDNAPGNSQGVQLHVTPGTDDQGSYFVLQGEGYFGGESLALWLRYPDNSVLDLGQIQAGPSGVLYYVLRLTGAPIGHYAFTGYGVSSARTGIAEFDLSVSDLTRASGVGQLQVGPSAGRQRSYAAFSGSGFAPDEIISIWVTLPDYSTMTIGDIKADDYGSFVAELYISEQEPVGKLTFTAYGNFSQVRAIADYQLAPGGPERVGVPEPDVTIGGPSGVRDLAEDDDDDDDAEEEPTPAPAAPTPTAVPYPAP